MENSVIKSSQSIGKLSRKKYNTWVGSTDKSILELAEVSVVGIDKHNKLIVEPRQDLERYVLDADVKKKLEMFRTKAYM